MGSIAMSTESSERVEEHAVEEHVVEEPVSEEHAPEEPTPEHATEATGSFEGAAENTLVGQPFPLEEDEIPESATQPEQSRSRLTKLARNHGLVFLVAILSFAAADTWSTLSGLMIADLLCVITAALAGISITTLAHEWFHYFGARFAKAHINIPTRQGLFVYLWDFGRNSPGQFLIMSIAGSIGGALAVILLWSTVPADTLGRAVLSSAAVASFIYSALIEWPVIRRVRSSGDPLAELSQISKPLLSRSLLIASVSGILLVILLMAWN
ncbi:Uncharacterised protein [Halioglobus japonicus]|nr:Uncharacterised protein [Halioglobus japonicus]